MRVYFYGDAILFGAKRLSKRLLIVAIRRRNPPQNTPLYKPRAQSSNGPGRGVYNTRARTRTRISPLQSVVPLSPRAASPHRVDYIYIYIYTLRIYICVRYRGAENILHYITVFFVLVVAVVIRFPSFAPVLAFPLIFARALSFN